MGIGIVFLIIALILGCPLISSSSSDLFIVSSLRKISTPKAERLLLRSTIVELFALVFTITFHCVVLTFSNSYIITEEQIIMFLLALICLTTSTVQYLKHYQLEASLITSTVHVTPTLVALCSRLNELFVSGHGQDPMIRKHWAHNNYVFITSLIILGVLRLLYFTRKTYHLQLSKTHTAMDIATMAFLSFSWVEKRSLEKSRHGYLSSRIAMILCTIGFTMLCVQWSSRKKRPSKDNIMNDYLHKTLMVIIKVLLFIVTVTGPSTAPTCVLLVAQVYALSTLTFAKGDMKVCFKSADCKRRVSNFSNFCLFYHKTREELHYLLLCGAFPLGMHFM